MQTKQAEANAVESGLLRFAHMWLQGSKASSDRPECQNVTTSDQHMQTIFLHKPSFKHLVCNLWHFPLVFSDTPGDHLRSIGPPSFYFTKKWITGRSPLCGGHHTKQEEVDKKTVNLWL